MIQVKYCLIFIEGNSLWGCYIFLVIMFPYWNIHENVLYLSLEATLAHHEEIKGSIHIHTCARLTLVSLLQLSECSLEKLAYIYSDVMSSVCCSQFCTQIIQKWNENMNDGQGMQFFCLVQKWKYKKFPSFCYTWNNWKRHLHFYAC